MRIFTRRLVGGAAIAVLALLAMPPEKSTAEEKEAAKAAEPGSGASTPKGAAAQTRPAQTRPARPAAKATRKDANGKPLAFTDEDLKKYRTGAATQPAPKATPPAAGGDPLKPFKDKAERARWRQTKVSEFHKTILDLEGRLKFLERKRLSIQNPLMPRPSDPVADPGAEEGLSGEELLAKNDEEIRATTQELEATRKTLATFLETTPE